MAKKRKPSEKLKKPRASRHKWYELDPKKHGVGGLIHLKPTPRTEDRRAKSWEGYAVIFFPQYKIGWKAQVGFNETEETLSQTAEAARIKYADRIGGAEKPDKKWKDYHRAGHRVRRVRIIDLGPA